MSATIFDGHRPISLYDKESLAFNFSKLAELSNGKFNPIALSWQWSGSNPVVSEIFWNGQMAALWIEHDWTVHTNLVLPLPFGLPWELRFNNVYGNMSGVPIVGRPRVESDMDEKSVMKILTESAYWQLALEKQPFALSMAREKLSLVTYHFYPYCFYLCLLDYLTATAERIQATRRQPVSVRANITPIELPWVR